MRSDGDSCKAANGNGNRQDECEKKQHSTSKHNGAVGMWQWPVFTNISAAVASYTPPSSDVIVLSHGDDSNNLVIDCNCSGRRATLTTLPWPDVP